MSLKRNTCCYRWILCFLIVLSAYNFVWKNVFPTASSSNNSSNVVETALEDFTAKRQQTTNTDSLKNSYIIDNNNNDDDGDDDEDASMAACLLVMDDNHFLIEWLAYHYHVLPLRHLIVAVDPRSKTSPSRILDRWRAHGMSIQEWTDDDYYRLNSTEQEEAEYWAKRKFKGIPQTLVEHRARQRLFYYYCMRQFKMEGRQWTLMIDSDEFLRVNYQTVKNKRLRLSNDGGSGGIKNKNSNNNNNDYEWKKKKNTTTTVRVPPVNESGSVLKYLQQELQRPGHNNNNNTLSSPCVQIPRIRFGALDGTVRGDRATTEKGWHSSSLASPSWFNRTDFLTLRFFRHAAPDSYILNKISKVMVDLRRVSWKELAPVESIHMPIKNLCKRRRLHIRSYNQVFVIHHYLGTWEQYSYRDDSRAGVERSRQVGGLCFDACLLACCCRFLFPDGKNNLSRLFHDSLMGSL